MNAKNDARHESMFGRRQCDGQGEHGEQLVLDCFNTDSAKHDSTTDSRYETAKRRAAEAMARAEECPTLLPALRAFCLDYARRGRRIEVHAVAGYLKQHNFINHSTGQDFDLNNNHLPFYLRLLAFKDSRIAECLRLRKSMFDLLDMSVYASSI